MTHSIFTDPHDVAALASLTATQELAVKWPKLLANMVDVANAALVRDGLAAQQAGHYARVVMLALGQYCGGVTTYIPTGDNLRRALRDDAIFRRFGKEAPVTPKLYGLLVQAPLQEQAVTKHCFGDCGRISMGGGIMTPAGAMMIRCHEDCAHLGEQTDEPIGTSQMTGEPIYLRALKRVATA